VQTSFFNFKNIFDLCLFGFADAEPKNTVCFKKTLKTQQQQNTIGTNKKSVKFQDIKIKREMTQALYAHMNNKTTKKEGITTI
jgi:hypothetical protein